MRWKPTAVDMDDGYHGGVWEKFERYPGTDFGNVNDTFFAPCCVNIFLLMACVLLDSVIHHGRSKIGERQRRIAVT